MKKNIMSLFIVFFTISFIASCNSSSSPSSSSDSQASSSSPSTPDKCVLQYYEGIINNDLKCLDLMAIRFVGGTDNERVKNNAELDKRIEKYNGDLSAVFFPYKGKLTEVELIPNAKGGAYTETKSRMLPQAEAAEVTVKLLFDKGKSDKETRIAVKINDEWRLY